MRSLLGQFGLHRLKDFALDQRWLGARAYLVLVADLANVKPIAQHVEKRALRECYPAPRLARRQLADFASDIALAKLDHQPIDTA